MSNFVFEMSFPEPKPVPDKPVGMIIKGRRLIEHHILCPDHDLRLRLVYNEERDSLYYRCPNWTVTDCDGTIGAHKDSGEPLGWPCDKATKKTRQEAHAAFDPLWQCGHKSRQEAYQWMQQVMNLNADLAHIGKFNQDQCVRLIHLVKRDFPGLSK